MSFLLGCVDQTRLSEGTGGQKHESRLAPARAVLPFQGRIARSLRHPPGYGFRVGGGPVARALDASTANYCTEQRSSSSHVRVVPSQFDAAEDGRAHGDLRTVARRTLLMKGAAYAILTQR